MPPQSNLIESGEPVVTGCGTKKWCAVATKDGELIYYIFQRQFLISKLLIFPEKL